MLGHIDHGKTSLIKALTGTDTDRLPDEKRRGMTIDLGFAYLDLPSHRQVELIDVPGHEAYVRHMLAGASGIDLGLLVVASDDGVMPQTREHLDILSLLHIPALVCALTKIDLIDDTIRQLAEEEVAEYLASTAYKNAPIVSVSSETGEGLGELKDALAERIEKLRRKRPLHCFKLPIDRSFTLQGIGCVVTGTVNSGFLKRGSELELHPGEKRVKARQLQVHGRSVEDVGPGQRTAINLAGIKTRDVQRGKVLATPGSLRSWRILNAELTLLKSTPKPLASFQTVRFHTGSCDTSARVILPAGKKKLKPGETSVCQMRLSNEVPAARGDFFVIRRASPAATLGGGRVIVPDTKRIRAKDEKRFEKLSTLNTNDPVPLLLFLFHRCGFHPPKPADLPPVVNAPVEEIQHTINKLCDEGTLADLGGGFVLPSKRVAELKELLISQLKLLHRDTPELPWISPVELCNQLPAVPSALAKIVIDLLAREGAVRSAERGIALEGHRQHLTEAQRKARETILQSHEESPFSPPDMETLATQAGASASELLHQYHVLEKEGKMVQIRPGLFLGADAVTKAGEATAALTGELESFAVKDFRDRLETTRKIAVPLLEYLDKKKVTIRKADSRRVATGSR